MAKIVACQSALRGCAKSYQVTLSEPTDDLFHFLQRSRQTITRAIKKRTKKEGAKLMIHACVKFRRELEAGELTFAEVYFNNPFYTVLKPDDADVALDSIFPDLLRRCANYQREGSNWTIHSVQSLRLHFARYRPVPRTMQVEGVTPRIQAANIVPGSSYALLPEYIANKKAVVNVKNADNQCFKWSVLAAIHPVEKHAERVSHYLRYAGELNFEGIDFPVSAQDYEKFEAQNDIGISVFGFRRGIIPLYFSRKTNAAHNLNLLLVESEETGGHYCWIKNLDRLLFDTTKNKNKKFFCRHCLKCCSSEKGWKTHEEKCGKVHATMPEKDTLQFESHHKLLFRPYVLFADVECILEPIQGCQQDPEVSSSRNINRHVPCAVAVLEVTQGCHAENANFGELFTHVGEDCIERFLEVVVSKAEAYTEWIARRDKELRLTAAEEAQFQQQTRCSICRMEIQGIKTRHHCHICSRFYGAAHQNCNLQCGHRNIIPVVMHNLRRYDGHLIMQKIGKIAREKGLEINCIPKNMEDYVMFSLRKWSRFEVRFINSYQFLASSLNKLTENLPNAEMKALRYFYANANQRDLLTRKGVFPYEHLTDWSVLQENGLPHRDAFYNNLLQESISEEDYRHAETVWETFQCDTLQDYMLTYLKSDVLLLTDVFQNFRLFCVEHYGPDPCNYVTLPAYSLDACLLKTGARVELMDDANMYTFFEAGIRGGVSVISLRYAKANNPDCEGYDPDMPVSWLFYCDMTNLYGWAMSQKMPHSHFEWVSPKDIEEVLNADPDGPYGYTVEVDLHYPPVLHDAHSDYPLAPERMKITSEQISEYCGEMSSRFGYVESEKLVPNLNDKVRYITHFRNLQYFVKKGLKIMEVHRIVKYRQEAWIRPFVEFNAEQRKQSTSEQEKTFFKFMSNSLFGKLMENVRAYRDVRLVTNERMFEKLAAKPEFQEVRCFDEDLVAVAMSRSEVELSKPIACGHTTLDLSKLHMAEFHYDLIKARYGSLAELAFTDTDSFLYLIETQNLYEDLEEMQDHFDFSEYNPNCPRTGKLFSLTNKKQMGIMKDETNGIPIEEFVGLRAKMYSFRKADKEEQKRAKGVSRAVVKNNPRHETYKQILFDGTRRRDEQQQFTHKQHHISTTKQQKITLSAYDDKRYMLDDGVHSLAYGHFMIGH